MRALALAVGVATATAAAATTYQPTTGTYQVKVDQRRCPSPMCGGYWIRALNHNKTTCADGTAAAWCYVSDIDFATMGWSEDDTNRFLQSVGTSKVVIYGAQHSVYHPAPNLTLGQLQARLVLKQYTP